MSRGLAETDTPVVDNRVQMNQEIISLFTTLHPSVPHYKHLSNNCPFNKKFATQWKL